MTDPSALFFPVIGVAIGFAILYLVIREAVGTALRDHQEWLEKRAAAAAEPPA